MEDDIIFLSSTISAEVKHFSPIHSGSEVFRVIFELSVIDPHSKKRQPCKEYEVWVSTDTVEDKKQLSNPTNTNIRDYAIEFLRERFLQRGTVPEENGAYITNTKIEFGNPRTFSLKAPGKPKLLKTTIMIPEDTHKWLKEYGYQRGIGIGEAIRRVVSDFQVGTATKQQEHEASKQDTSGVAPIKIDKKI